MHKCRGEAKTLETMFAEMKNFGFCGGKVKIDHCMNPGAADILKEKILSEFPETDIKIGINRGLCSFYAEKGGLLVGFEG